MNGGNHGADNSSNRTGLMQEIASALQVAATALVPGAIGLAHPVAGVLAAPALNGIQSFIDARRDRNQKAYIATVVEAVLKQGMTSHFKQFLAEPDGAELFVAGLEAAVRARGEKHASVLASLIVGASVPEWSLSRDLAWLLLSIVGELSYEEMRLLGIIFRLGRPNGLAFADAVQQGFGQSHHLLGTYASRLRSAGLVAYQTGDLPPGTGAPAGWCLTEIGAVLIDLLERGGYGHPE